MIAFSMVGPSYALTCHRSKRVRRLAFVVYLYTYIVVHSFI